jgi:hypothetical protein
MASAVRLDRYARGRDRLGDPGRQRSRMQQAGHTARASSGPQGKAWRGCYGVEGQGSSGGRERGQIRRLRDYLRLG